MQRVPHEAIALLLPKMPGMDNSVIVKRSAEGDFSTAGFWDSSRPIRGLITQSRSSNLKITNTAFVNFLEDGQGFALEACAKCKVQQGGVTTHFGNISFQAEDPSKRHALVRWSWNHQGVFLDTDYSLVGEDCEGLNFCDRSIMPGPAIVADNGLLQSADCNETLQSFKLVGGRLCRPGLVHRRFMLNSHLPYSIHFEDLLIRWQDPSNPGVTLEDAVPFSRYNDHGYQATLIAGRNYTLAWSMFEVAYFRLTGDAAVTCICRGTQVVKVHAHQADTGSTTLKHSRKGTRGFSPFSTQVSTITLL